jgi:GYF domain 2
MEYLVAREGKTYGPYTEDELRQYLASGNVVESDLARSDTMTDWQPLRKVLPKLKKQKQPKTGKLNPAGLRKDLPSPPDLPWWIGLLLEGFSGMTFFLAWNVVEAVWLYRVQKSSLRTLIYYSGSALFFLVGASSFLSRAAHKIFSISSLHSTGTTLLTDAPVLALAVLLLLVARFSMRRSLLEHFNGAEPIGLKLSWFWTLLFGGLYFQYHFNRINALKRAAANPPIAPSPAR